MNNYRILIRSLFKSGNLNIVKILSLAAALSVCLALFSKVIYVSSFDTFYPDYNRIYTIGAKELINSQLVDESMYFSTPGGVAVGIRDEVKGVEAATRITPLYSGNLNITTENHDTFRSDIIMADSCFFDVFSIPVLVGNAQELLSTPLYALVSESTAAKIKGEAIGQTLMVETLSDRRIIIGGIFKDLPSNSSIEYDIILSLESIPYFEWDGRLLWQGNDRYESFVKLAPNAQYSQVNRDIQLLSQKQIPPEIIQNNTTQTEYYLYPLTEAYSYINGVSDIIYILSVLASIVIIAAMLNYVMFSFSTLLVRSKEIATLKCFGAQSADVMLRLVLETIINLFLVFIITFAIIIALKPIIESLLETSIYSLSSALGLNIILLTFIVLIVTVGIIPSLAFSKIPLVAAYSNFGLSKYKYLRKSLLFIQLCITSILLVLLLNTNSQYNSIISENLGYKYDKLLYTTSLRNQSQSVYSSVIQQLKSLPQVENVSTSSFLLQARNTNKVVFHGEELFPFVDFGYVNHDIISTYDINLLEGSTFSENSINGDILVSRSFASKLEKAMNWDNGVVGKIITSTSYNSPLNIVGIFDDINTGNAISPNVGPSMFAFGSKLFPVLLIKVNAVDIETKHAITNIINSSTNSLNIDVRSYEEFMFSNYSEVSKFRQSLLWGFIITLIIVISGLSAYIYNEISKRNKEIAIRKAYGANATSIIGSYVVDILKMAIPAIFIGMIVAWFVTDESMKNFSNQEVSFVLNYILSIFSVAFLIISLVVFICYKKTRICPIGVLKS